MMSARYSAGLLFAALMAGSAMAAPLLKPAVTVTGELVTVGDLFDDAGAFAETPMFRAPAPGTVGAVDSRTIDFAARRVGLGDYDDAGLSTVRVERVGVPVDLGMITAMVADELRARGEMGGATGIALGLDAPLGRLYAAADSGPPASLFDLTTVPSSDRFTARLQVAGRSALVSLTGRIDTTIEAPFLAESLSAGELIAPEHIDMRPVPVKRLGANAALTLDDVVGMTARRAIRAGTLLGPRDVIPPQLVARNQTVTLTYRAGPLTLTARGQALSAAALGEPVTVLNLVSNKVVDGVVSGPGAVAVGPHGIRLADAS